MKIDALNTTETIPVFSKWFGSWQFNVQRKALNENEIAKRYDRSSTDWHQTVERLGFLKAYETLLEQAINNDEPSNILDCGVGSGALSLSLTNIVKNPIRLSAVDLSPNMLEKAREVLGHTNTGLNLYQANALELPFEDKVFDMVMTSHMIEHLPEPALALGEMVRVLKPGGRLVVCITRQSLMSILIQLKWRTHRIGKDQAIKLLSDAGLIEIQNLNFNQMKWCQKLSLAFCAKKPF